jgi:hypothetical protein
MDCAELEHLLGERCLTQLSAEEQHAVAAHVEVCEACRARWGLDQESQALHKVEEAFAPHVSVRDAVLAKVREAGLPPGAGGAEEGPKEPERVGGFRILGRLGRGGMGTVYRALQLSMDRTVALKLLPSHLAQDEQYVGRFLREARAAARLRHPHIVQAHDVGFADGCYFFAMEYVDGENLGSILRREGPLAPGRALEYMKQTCRALAAAHKAGIIHRDIKPSNLMVDREGAVRVTDFGLARRMEGDLTVTAEGQMLGTPAYISPEMAAGEAVDPRSDLYSLGATFYHVLAGRPPLEGRSFLEVVHKHVSVDPTPLAEVAPDVDCRLCGIIDRLLSKSPDARFSTAEELLAELEALPAPGSPARGAGAGSDAPTPRTEGGEGHEGRAERRGRRAGLTVKSKVIAVGAGVVVLLVVAAALLAGRGPRTGQHPADGEGAWQPLFDGKALGGWMAAGRFPVPPGDGSGKGGHVRVEEGRVILEAGDPLTGIVWTGDFPRENYEATLDAMRLSGRGDFCIVVFPVGASQCVFGLGLWDGDLVGLDAIDGLDTRSNGTGRAMSFDQERWYKVRLRVTPASIEAWVDAQKVISVSRAGRTFSADPKWMPLTPFGVGAAWGTRAALRGMALRRL